MNAFFLFILFFVMSGILPCLGKKWDFLRVYVFWKISFLKYIISYVCLDMCEMFIRIYICIHMNTHTDTHIYKLANNFILTYLDVYIFCLSYISWVFRLTLDFAGLYAIWYIWGIGNNGFSYSKRELSVQASSFTYSQNRELCLRYYF